MKKLSGSTNDLSLDIVGSSNFGRDPKIMSSRTFNMITADDFLIDYAGYSREVSINDTGVGRGIFSSIRGNLLVVVVSNKVYAIRIFGYTSTGERIYDTRMVGEIDTFYGAVFIDENNVNQIAICDQKNIWIYNHTDGSFQLSNLPEYFRAGYVSYQDGSFIAPDLNSSVWAMSSIGNGLDWLWNGVGGLVSASIQTKPDYAQVTMRASGRGNLLYVMGKTATEFWTNVGAAKFRYQRSTSLNLDYGCISAESLASIDSLICWLGSNEKSGPVILFSNGGEAQQLSTDGINYQLSLVKHPEKSCGFFIKLAGHIVYQLTFYDYSDNWSIAYDFTTQSFFDLTDSGMNCHIARRAAFFDGEYYFVSLNDPNVYRMGPDIYTFNGAEIPRIRICKNIRVSNSYRFVVNSLSFILEQGNDPNLLVENPNYQPRIGLSISKDGGYSFSGYSTKKIYPYADRPNRLNWLSLGMANDFVAQIRFWGRGPWRCTNGVVGAYQ